MRVLRDTPFEAWIGAVLLERTVIFLDLLYAVQLASAEPKRNSLIGKGLPEMHIR